MTIRFNLHNQQADVTTIYIIATVDGRKVANLSTSQKIRPRNWNTADGKARRSHPGSVNLNALLDRMRTAWEDAYRAALLDGRTVSREELAAVRDRVLKRKPRRRTSVVPRDLFGFLDYFIQERSENPEFAAGTVQHYRSVRALLHRFNPDLEFRDISIGMLNRLVVYLYEQGQQTNRVAKVVSILRTMLRDAADRGIEVPPVVWQKKFRVKKRTTDAVYLTHEEIGRLIHVELPSERLRRVRDRALVGCFTGQRVSDLKRLSRETFYRAEDGTEMFRLKTQKSGRDTEVVIPVHPIARQIMERYDWHLPRISDQKFNVYLKEVCELAGIDTPFTKTIDPKGQVKEVTGPKWQFVAAHTLRRTFITNALLDGVPERAIMDVVGIKKAATLAGYYVAGPEQGARVVADFHKRHAGRYLRRVD